MRHCISLFLLFDNRSFWASTMRADSFPRLANRSLLVAVLVQGAEPGTNPSTQPSSESLAVEGRIGPGSRRFWQRSVRLDSRTRKVERFRPVTVAMEIDVPAGCTVWLKQRLDGPVMIEYEATVLRAGGANDRVSDLNCFWMARDSRSPDDLFATPRSGKFADYNPLKCYYVGLGGNTNTTTRFRRYVGDTLLTTHSCPQNDLRRPEQT